MSTRRALIAMVKIAQKELGLDDDTYRDVLARVTGQRSAAECSDAQLQDVIDEFRAKGWSGGKPGFRKSARPEIRKIYALWGEARRKGAVNDRTPRAFVRRMADVDDPEFLTAADARKVTEAIKAMIDRRAAQQRTEADG